MRLLVVEDDPDLRAGLSQALREEGYAVDASGDGNEALHQAQSINYDAIVLDVMLPGRSGLEILAELRRSHVTPVLLLTAKDTVADRVTGLDTGADDYLVKPFDLSELFARLRSLIRRNHGIADTVIELGDVSIDTASRTIRRRGASVDLKPREYALVELMAMNRGRLVNRSMIYDHLFDDEHDSMSNLVDVYVSRIRSKLGKDFLTTRRGEGYLIEN